MQVCQQLIEELGAGHLPVVTALNKVDLCAGVPLPHLSNAVAISAKTGRGIDDLLALLEAVLAQGRRTVELLIPYSQGKLVEQLHEQATVLELSYQEEGTWLKVRGSEAALGRVAAWRV